MANYARIGLTFERGEGPYLFDASGERYLDFGCGIGVTSLGHAHPHVVAALEAQAKRLWHVSNLYEIGPQARLADRLVANSFADRVFFCNSGGEAMEASLKLARIYQTSRGAPERHRAITFRNAFHGRTLATIAAGGQAKHLKGFEPAVDAFDQVDLNDLAATRAAITNETAALVVEPIQGEGGIHVASTEFLQGLRALADEAGLVLIFDEVQSGVGRTGKFFAHEWAETTPDIMAVAKALGNGFPIGACLAREEVAAAMVPGSHGTTFGGNPLATEVGNAVLDVVLADGFLDQVQQTGAILQERLTALAGNKSVFTSVRGRGLMLGLECVVPNIELMGALRENKLLALPADGNVLRMLPPLTIGAEQIDEACDSLERACATVGS
jgi:acetylornithine/N-succinyldiaminopimelate aminotransferase